MKKSLKKATSAFLALVMCFSLIQIPALADNDSADEMQGEDSIEEVESIEVVDTQDTNAIADMRENSIAATAEQSISETIINPLYNDIVTEDDLLSLSDIPKTLATDEEAEESIQDAIKSLRAGMVSRTNEVSVNIYLGDLDAYSAYQTIVDGAFSHTGESNEGDYLVAHFAGMEINGGPNQYLPDLYNFTFVITYYTDIEQEQAVTEKLAEVMPTIISDNMSDYEKICAIYHYITYNVKYDDEGAAGRGTNGDLMFTAYAALIDNCAVCQGYASLFYRMVLEAGIDCRFVCGTANGTDHAWNIVKLGNIYYNVDSTWDATYTQNNLPYEYFMLGSTNFDTDHVRVDENGFDSLGNRLWAGSPWSVYPVSESNCTEEIIYHDLRVSDSTATCTEDGTGTYSCVICPYTYEGKVSATGHTWEEPTFEWADDYSSATATRECNICGATETVEAEIDVSENNNERTYTAKVTFDEKDYFDYEVVTIIPEGDHEWVIKETTWANDCSYCKIELICTDCDVTVELDAEVECTELVEPTCEKAGYATYVGTVDVNGDKFSDSRTISLEATGHDWDVNNADVNWENYDFVNNDGTVYVAERCTKCGEIAEGYAAIIGTSEITEEPTCTENGGIHYYAEAEFNGHEYIGEYVEIIYAAGHEWSEPVWTWSNDGTTAIATFICTKCDEVVPVDATVTNETIKEATCTENGTIMHTATVEFNDDTYTDSMETTIQASGHSWTATETVESEDSDKTVIEVNMVCMNCGKEETGTVVFNTTGSNVNSMSSYSWSSLIGIQSLANYIADNSYVEFEILVEPSSTTSSAVEDKIDELYDKDEWKHDTSYLNIVITMNVYDENDKLIDSQTFSETTDPIDFTIDIPEELLGDEEYALIRVHDGVAEQIDFENNADGTLSFSSDKFSTYAVVGLTAIQDDTGTGTSNPDSEGNDGDNNDNDSGSGTGTGTGDGTSDNGTTASNDGTTTSTDSTESANGTTTTDNGGKEDTSGGKEATSDVKTGDPSIALFCTAGILLATCGTLAAATQHRRKEEDN